jgi:type VI secretion system protein ImpB
MPDNIQQKIGRNRPPKVHITYDAHVDGATKKVELPFVVAVLADLSNREIVDAEGEKIPVAKRKLKEVDRDNFTTLLASIAPQASVRVPNKLDDSGGELSAKLTFKSMDDFRPDNVARNVPALRALLEMREKLADCKSRIDGNEKLERELKDIIDKTQGVGGK